jgi:polyisoprenoid-binding protein YceI
VVVDGNPAPAPARSRFTIDDRRRTAMTPPPPTAEAHDASRVGRHRKLLIGLGIVAVAGILAAAAGLWYVLIGPSGPAAVDAGPPAVPSNAAVAAPASLDGEWTIVDDVGSVSDGTSTFAGYRVQEQLVGVGGHTAVGRTPKVTGSMTLAGATVSDINVTVDMTGLVSDDPFRDSQLQRQAIETDRFPTSTFRAAEPIDLGSVPAEGQTVATEATGELTLHGVTRAITVSLQARRVGGIIAVTGSMPILFPDWSIQRPTSFSVLSVDDHGTMEFHLVFVHS